MEPTPLWNFLEALLPNDPAEDARPEWLGLADPQRGQGFPPAQRARMVAVARRRRASAPLRVARARRQVEDFLARLDDGARAELATDCEPSTLPERVDRSLAGIAGALESLLPRAVRARRDLRLTIRGSGGRITVAWLDVPDSAPVDLLELAIARFCFMGELTDRSARLLAAEFVRAVREGAEFLPGFEAVRERGADLARYALMTSLAQPVGGDGQLAERLASLLAMSPRRDAPPQSSAEIAGLVADLTTVSGAGEDEVREALRGMLARRARSLAEGDAARERCLAHARALAAGT